MISPQEMFTQATRLHNAGRLEEAAALYRRLLPGQRRNVDLLFHLGVCLHQAGQCAEARRTLEQALKLRPDAAALHLGLAAVQAALRLPREALASYRRAARLAPADPEPLLGEAGVIAADGDHAAAEKLYREALARAPGNAAARAGIACSLQLQGRAAEALEVAERLLDEHPHLRAVANNRGVLLTQLGRAADAVAAFDALLADRADDAQVHSNRGNALYELDQLEAALAAQDTALALAPDFLEAHMSRAATLMALRRLDEALGSLDRVVKLDARHRLAHHYRAMIYLLRGEFAPGWPEFEWRAAGVHGIPERAKLAPPRADRGNPGSWSEVPRWTGRAPLPGELQGRTMLLYNEQGHGDTVQFLRYVPLVQALGADVVVRVQPALVTLVQRALARARVVADACVQAGGEGDAMPVPVTEAAGRADRGVLRCPLLSLPHAFDTTLETIPPPLALTPDPARMQAWRDRLALPEPEPASPAGPRPRVIGLAWSGNAANTMDARRSILLADVMATLAAYAPPDQPPVRYLGLQPDLRDADRAALAAHPQLVHPGAQIADFEDSAALIGLCDLVISVDTAIAHLAGSLGKPTWVLLHYAADWRWHLAPGQTPWYPGMRLFRQAAPGDWHSALARLGNALHGS